MRLTSYVLPVLAITMFVLSVTICKIITYELPNVLIRIFDHEMKEVKEIDLDENGMWMHIVNMYVCKYWCF